jgi:hypothetical protein
MIFFFFIKNAYGLSKFVYFSKQNPIETIMSRSI